MELKSAGVQDYGVPEMQGLGRVNGSGRAGRGHSSDNVDWGLYNKLSQ